MYNLRNGDVIRNKFNPFGVCKIGSPLDFKIFLRMFFTQWETVSRTPQAILKLRKNLLGQSCTSRDCCRKLVKIL